MSTIIEPASTTKVIEVFADVVCPFTHVGLKKLVAYRSEIGRDDVALRLRSWPLEIVNGEPLARELLEEEIAELRKGVAAGMFEGFDPTLFPLTSLPALELAAHAYRADVRSGERVSLALREALFEHGRDISDPRELATIASCCDVDLPDGDDAATVFADLSEGRARGVIGSPHFFVDDHGFFCPSLDIARVDGHMRISTDPAGFASFVELCFGAKDR